MGSAGRFTQNEPVTASARRSSPPAERVGRYLLYRSVGSGGMGEVFKARVYGPAGVQKDLCVKRIRRERLARPGAVERFVAEARTSMQLAHGNIVQVFDFGRAGDEYFLAMEWVDGADLRAILDRCRGHGDVLAPGVAAHVAACVARALAHAHEPGRGRPPVVHCDVKPENILVSSAGEVKLTDFGAAAIAGQGAIGGTADYMSPEQRAGAVAAPTADLHSLGLVLFEMLAGALPGHGGARPERIPEELRPCLDSLLEADPEKRPRRALDVAERLEHFVSKTRADGGVVPQSALAASASAAHTEAQGRPTHEPLGADASFVRDGETVDFAARMTATTGAPSIPAPAASASSAPASTRRGTAWFVAGGALGGAAITVFVVLGLVLRAPDEAPPVSTARTASLVRQSPADAPATQKPASPVAEPIPTSAAPVAPQLAPAAADVPSRPARRDPAAARAPRPAPNDSPTGAAATTPAGDAPPSEEPARLDVNAIPWAEVWIDGRRVGDTPLFDVRVAPGPHALELRNPALGASRTLRLDLSAGESREVVTELR